MDGTALARGNSSALTRSGRDALPASAEPASRNSPALKTPATYLRALRRRIWLVLVVAIPLAIMTSTLALRVPRVYQARAEITIEPPELNPLLQTLIGQELGRHDPVAQDKYVPNRIAYLQSKILADAVVADASVASELASFDDPAQELIINALQVRPVGKTNWYIVLLEGRDPARTKKLLELLLKKFKELSELENRTRLDETKEFAMVQLQKMEKDLEDTDKKIDQTLRTVQTIGPSGRNLFEDQYIDLGNMLIHKQMRLGELSQQLLIAESFPKTGFGPEVSPRDQQIARLEAEKTRWIRILAKAKRIENPRQFDRDPAVKEYAQRLAEILDELDALRAVKTRMADNPTQLILDHFKREIEDDKMQHQTLLAQMRESMPDHQRFLTMVDDRKQIQTKLAGMQENIVAFETLKLSQKAPITIPARIVEPVTPVRPSRTLYIGMGLMLSFGLGIGLVVLLEHVDHSVKVPEHVTQGLGLTLLGVVPRIRRLPATHRGGHLWTPGTPNSLEADAFRNIRASLLGAADNRGPIITLLVTSPKSGDGKSTAALNIAGTCARAGERTLLVDVDLRRPTLGEVFPPEPEKEGTRSGLVDVLQGFLPWQKTLRRTELPNLDFIAAGDPRDVPIEILGTLELRQLLSALANHYDRVILDGPAVLGMADCRMLGRMVDASLLVVRSGAHSLVTLQRAKIMLEQSHVPLAGVIVNNLREDYHHWSSYDDAATPSSWERRGLPYDATGPGRAGASGGAEGS